MAAQSNVPRSSNVVEDAHALTLFRILPNGEGRNYTATTFPRNPWAGCERFVRTGFAVGWLVRDDDVTGASYALLDVLDERGDIVQDFPIRDAAAFQQVKRRLNLRVEAGSA